MKTLKFEMAAAGIALFALGAFVATRPTGADAAVIEPAGARAFSQADFERFDRGFMLDGQPCAVGIELHKLCFAHSPQEKNLHRGMILPPEVPLMAAEFRIIVDTDLKEAGLRTLRFGQTLALVEPETRTVVDMLRLTAPTAADAHLPVPAIG